MWKRICPECNKIVEHKNRISWARSKRLNKKCLSCSHKGNILTLTTRKKLSEALKNRHFSIEHRRKIAVAQRKRLNKENGYRAPRYNPEACKIFEEINRVLGWDGQHAESGGEYYVKELGYWVDYYDPKRNIVIEYDEDSHYTNGYLREEDYRRELEIVFTLQCKFYRIRETDWWPDVLLPIKGMKLKRYE